MADEADMASDREQTERDRMIAFSRAKVVPEPDLGCKECMDYTHSDAKENCEYFTNCLSDWQRVQIVKRIGGKNA